MIDKEALSREDQDCFERFVFRVLDVDHKDYQIAKDGFVAICDQADVARRRAASLLAEFPADEDVEMALEAYYNTERPVGEELISRARTERRVRAALQAVADARRISDYPKEAENG